MSEVNTNFLKDVMPKFFDWLDSEEGKDFADERGKKDFFIQSYLAEGAIDNFDEGALRELVGMLWSFGYWTNKDWIVDQILHSGLREIRDAFKELLYSKKRLSERFDQMRKIDQMGAATISEILAHFDHDNYAIWNKRAKSSLIKLGVSENSLPKGSQITGTQYEDYLKVVKPFFKKISQRYPKITDLITLDFLLYYVSIVGEEIVEKPLIESSERFEHDTVINHILQLGDGLGFDVSKEYTVTSGCRIDVIWKSRVANLGTITYAFEVHNKGSRDSAILNLQRIFNADPTVQKAIIVAKDVELAKFKEEIVTLSEDFRNSVVYFSVQYLEEALLHQEELKRILAVIGLMKTRVKTES
jgi:hypothetical protein